MPIDTLFTAGTIAKHYIQIAQWVGGWAEEVGARDICLPFIGMGRMASAICNDDTVIDGCDFQRITSSVFAGVFNAEKYETNVDKPRFRKGEFYHGSFIRDMADLDPRSAGFCDWVATNGTPLDVACIGMAIPGQTLRGWMTRWTGDFETLWYKFCLFREQCKPFIPRPGVFNYTECDMFETDWGLHKKYDLLVADPPRLTGTTDPYSYTWTRLNKCLLGESSIKPWNMTNYRHHLRRLLQIDARYLSFTWTFSESGLTVTQAKEFVESYGTIVDETEWTHRKTTVYGWRVER
jgi:hypothetical protein